MKQESCELCSLCLIFICIPPLLIFSQLLIITFMKYGAEHTGECFIIKQEIIEESWAQITLCLLESDAHCSTVEVCNSMPKTEMVLCLNERYQVNHTVSCYWYEEQGEKLYLNSMSHYNFYLIMTSISTALTFVSVLVLLYSCVRKYSRVAFLETYSHNRKTIEEEIPPHFSLIVEGSY